MTAESIERVKRYVLSHLDRKDDSYSQAEFHLDNAIAYVRQGSQYGAEQQIRCCVHYLNKGGSSEREMARYIENNL